MQTKHINIERVQCLEFRLFSQYSEIDVLSLPQLSIHNGTVSKRNDLQ